MYIDPGFGSMLFQALAALLISCAAYVTACRRGLRKFIFKQTKSDYPMASPGEPGSGNAANRAETDENGFLK